MQQVIELFKEAMGRLATGVTVVTSEVDGRPWGVTVSACCSISMDPPLLLISLFTKNASTEAIKEQQRFGVSILSKDQTKVAKAGAKPGTPKFFEEFTDFDHDGKTHMVKDALTHIHCKVDNVVAAGDHTIFIGLVEHVTIGEFTQPLLHFHRQFGIFTDELEQKETVVK
ncbi:flavin reductase [Peribacillus cavernae]|uniref:Flavin reductase n=1 Tax=Peribacillus cavernae TaxID=1674310 RepID=A0A3S0TY84_9BACI|nr:flavin reductase family protein [Peribacillus cavernae]MDQ0217395.1 flavin reductase ActVB [Peribacillus cavernae]RUQ30156.1 flavin reductase [Peribacillus cavernae]